jgi:hypothetical protein
MKQKIVCPHCGKQDTWQEKNPYRPFCSERCRLIDLGAWANEDYRIPDKADNSKDKEDEN